MLMDRRRDVAREIARIYCPMSPMGIQALANILVPIKLSKGERLLQEGEVCGAMYFVDKGMVRQFYYKNGKDVTEHFSYEGRIVFCIESFLKQEPSRLMVETLESSVLFAIPYEQLHMLMNYNQEILTLYRKILEESLIMSQIHADLVRFETAQDRYKRLCKLMPQVVLRAPLVYIASYLQMTPETLSRVRASTLLD